MNPLRIIRSFQHAFRGILDIFLHCPNMRIHILAALLAMVLAFILKISPMEWCLILTCVFVVIAAEMINSAIEYTIDLVTKEQKELAKKAKDAAAGAVLILAIFSLLTACIIFIPKIIKCC